MPFLSKKPSKKAIESRRRFFWQLLALPSLLQSCDKADLSPGFHVGASLPSFELHLLDGERQRLGEASTPCLINFWATWCPPCRAEMASLNRLYGEYQHRGLTVFAISVDDDPHLVREFVRQIPLDFPILLDPGGRVTATMFGVAAFPTTFLITNQALVDEIWIGERNWEAADIRASIDRQFKS